MATSLVKPAEVIDNFKLYSFVDPDVNPYLAKCWKKLANINEELETTPMFLLVYKPLESKSADDTASFSIAIGKARRCNVLDMAIDNTEFPYTDGKLTFKDLSQQTLETYKEEFVRLVCSFPELYEKAFV
jgi:inhibitor of KinA sporulation pathway (predicted exonuclease)